MTDFNTSLTNNQFSSFFNMDADPTSTIEEKGASKLVKLEKNKQFSAVLLAFIKQKINELEDEVDLMETIFIADNVIQHLKNLRTLFRILQEENLSQSLDYALKLSKAWNGILNYQTLATSKEMRADAYEKITKLVELFARFPTADEHALGHYLANYAGENWLPFPFMGILNDLYEENLQNAKRSNLAILIKMISNILESFQIPHT
ncbi:MAG: hypothetical protein K9M07_01575 [Simkaniaceae bacterium]|nr:hypothetical protein [Simkaniaceae bacterium]